jgi:hypothetical protein
MQTIAVRTAGHRGGRPLFLSLTEAAVMVLVAAALIAAAAIPALVRHPNYAQAKAHASQVARTVSRR